MRALFGLASVAIDSMMDLHQFIDDFSNNVRSLKPLRELDRMINGIC